MKKILVLMLLVCLFALTGCDYTEGAKFGRLLDIKYYTLDYEEINGEYVDYFRFNWADDTSLKQTKSLKPLNSPKPIYNYYYAEIEEGTDVIVRFTIKENNGYKFTCIIINNVSIYADDFINKHVDGNIIYLDYLCSNINAENKSYAIYGVTFEITNNGKTTYASGSTWIEGRTYIKGFLFNFNNNNLEKQNYL